MFTLARRLIFLPPRCACERVPKDAFVIEACHPVYARYAEPKRARLAVLYSHGVREDMKKSIEFVDQLSRRLNVAVLTYEYCGYGCSGGKASDECVLRSAEAAYKWLRRRWPEQNIVLWGKSLGSAPTSYLSSKHCVAGLVLESAFLSSYRGFKDYTGALAPLFESLAPLLNMFLPLDSFPNDEWLEDCEAPVLVLHGRDDGVVDAEHARCLARQLDATLWLGKAGHQQLERLPGYWRAVGRFFRSL